MSASRPLCRTSSLGESIPRTRGPTDIYPPHRSVPTKDQILVPETLLKKRKSQEKERAEAAEKRDARKKVHIILSSALPLLYSDEKISNNTSTSLRAVLSYR